MNISYLVFRTFLLSTFSISSSIFFDFVSSFFLFSVAYFSLSSSAFFDFVFSFFFSFSGLCQVLFLVAYFSISFSVFFDFVFSFLCSFSGLFRVVFLVYFSFSAFSSFVVSFSFASFAFFVLVYRVFCAFLFFVHLLHRPTNYEKRWQISDKLSHHNERLWLPVTLDCPSVRLRQLHDGPRWLFPPILRANVLKANVLWA